MDMNIEELAVFIIANAGDSKSNSLAAIEAAKEGDFEKAHKYLELSEKALVEAHKSHTHLIVKDSKEGLPLTFLLVHASNHLSNAELAKEFAEQLVYLYERR